MEVKFLIHPRSPEEAVEEFRTDISRRLIKLRSELKREKQKTGSNKKLVLAGLDRCIFELDEMLEFWQSVEVKREARRKKTKNTNLTQKLTQEFVEGKQKDV